jgi:hypothetical protein
MKNINRLISILIAMALVTGCAEKYELDRKMEELCKKDGGVKIYETVKLPHEMFDKFGHPHFSGEWNVKKLKNGETLTREISGLYIFIEEINILKNGDPLKGEGRLSQTLYKIQRNSDNRILAEAKQYLRAGGDLLTLGHHSSKACPAEQKDLIEQVFVKI